MSGESFRTRDFVPVPPHLRPRRRRRAVRIVVTDGASVLLLADTDPGVPGSTWWVTPGGGIDPGEDELTAAVRELAEETGRQVEPSALLGPIRYRTVVHGYSDHILTQDESFYLLRVSEAFEVDTSGHTPDERLTLVNWAWHRLDDLAALPDPVWPAYLAELAAAGGASPFVVDHVHDEESTVPVEREVEHTDPAGGRPS